MKSCGIIVRFLAANLSFLHFIHTCSHKTYFCHFLWKFQLKIDRLSNEASAERSGSKHSEWWIPMSYHLWVLCCDWKMVIWWARDWENEQKNTHKLMCTKMRAIDEKENQTNKSTYENIKVKNMVFRRNMVFVSWHIIVALLIRFLIFYFFSISFSVHSIKILKCIPIDVEHPNDITTQYTDLFFFLFAIG